jgi:hypothetical protein
MPSMSRNTTYDCVVIITHEYLGPAAERFINRQVRNHLHKDPEDITKKDLSSLTDFIRLAVSLLTDDVKVVDSYIGKLEQVAHAHASRRQKAS